MAKKIKINKDKKEKSKEQENVLVKKSKRFQILKKHEQKIDNEVEELYSDADRLYQPMFMGNKLWAVVIIAIIVSMISGMFASFYILSKKQIALPWGTIDLTAYFPTHTTTIVREQNVTVAFDQRIGVMRNELNKKIVHIFEAKQVPENGTVPFLEQVYMPDKAVAQGLVITKDGWILAPSLLEGPTLKYEYIVVDNEAQEFVPQDIFTAGGFTFLKIEKQTDPIEFAAPDEIIDGRQVFLIDNANNTHFAKISQAQYRAIDKPEDLVRSTDIFSNTIVLDNTGLVNAFSSTYFQASEEMQNSDFEFPNERRKQGPPYIYGLDGKAIGVIDNEQVIPLWRIADKINSAIETKEIVYPYLGIDYVRIEKTPGLTSPLFKDLKNGAVVYGPPISESPASEVGIKNANVIISVDDIVLDKNTNFTYLIQRKNPGDIVTLTYLRDGKEITTEIELGEKE